MNERHVDLIQEQVPEATRSEVIAALLAANTNVVDAIMALSTQKDEASWRSQGIKPRDVRFLCKKYPRHSIHTIANTLVQSNGVLVLAMVTLGRCEEEYEMSRRTEHEKEAPSIVVGQRFITQVNYLVKRGVLEQVWSDALAQKLKKVGLL